MIMRFPQLALAALAASLLACSSDSSDPADAGTTGTLVDSGADGSGGAGDSGQPDIELPSDVRRDAQTPDISENDAEPSDVDQDATECSDGTPCSDGDICVGGTCVAPSCEPDESRCSGDDILLRCVDGEFLTIPCADDSACETTDDGARCGLPACTPNAVGCADAFSAYVCDGQGTDRFILPCNDDQYCVDGVCRTQTCTPGQRSCAGNTAESCDALGSELSTEDCVSDCPEGLTCACSEGACTQALCRPDSTRCDGNTRIQCDADGNSETRSTCGDDVCIAGECVDSACEALTAECIGDTLSTCNSTGTARTTENCLDSASYCSAGQCVAQSCAPGSSVCLDIDTRNICNERGTGRSSADCSPGTFCSTGSCVAAVCEPGSTRCSGTRLQTCDAAGSGFASSSCPGEQECRTVGGTTACTNLACDVGEVQCAIGTNARLRCNDDQTGFDTLPCTSSQVCTAGSCVTRVCTEGASRCSGTNVENCVDGGLRWQQTTCTTGQVCSLTGGVATCGAQLCTPGSAATCRDGDVQTCNAAGTGYNLVTDCPYGCQSGRCNTNRLGGTCASNAGCSSGLYCSNNCCIPDNTIYVPSGSTDIGTDRTESWITVLERPRHTLSRNHNVIVEKFEVTQLEWTAVLGTNPSYFATCGTDCPVESVNLYDVIYYLNQRSREDGLTPCYTMVGCAGAPGTGCLNDGLPASTYCDGDFTCESITTVLRCDGFRLPTNSEWETAAGTDGSDYPGGVNNVSGTPVCTSVPALSNYAQYCANSHVTYTPCANLSLSSGPACAGPAPVGSFLPLPSGLYDALGNVYEWVWDNDDAYPFGLTAEPVVRTLQSTDYGIRRGGGWWSYVTNARLTQRDRTLLNQRSNLSGFRIARTMFPAPCYNGVRDAGETDVDCGSPDCSDCP